MHESAHLRQWLADLTVDVSQPLWLAEGRVPAPERAEWVVPVVRRMRNQRLVITDRALRLFSTSQARSAGELVRANMHGPTAVFGEYVDKVDRGELDDQISSVAINDVVRATLSPMIGGHWWRLRVRTAEAEAIVVRGNGDARDIHTALDEALGERLRATWLNAPAPIRKLRNAFGYLCLGFGGLGVVVGAIYRVHPSQDLSRIESLELGVASIAVVLLGFLPDALAAVFTRSGRTPPDRRLFRRAPGLAPPTPTRWCRAACW